MVISVFGAPGSIDYYNWTFYSFLTICIVAAAFVTSLLLRLGFYNFSIETEEYRDGQKEKGDEREDC